MDVIWRNIYFKGRYNNCSNVRVKCILIKVSSSSSVYRVYSSLSVILQRDSQDKSPAGQYLQLKTGGNLIYTVRNWAGGKLPSVSLNSSTELAVVAADGRLFQSRMDLGKKEFR